MRVFLAILLLVVVGCGTSNDTVKRQLASCQKRLDVVEQRQRMVEEMLDEALSKWNLVEEAVKRLEKMNTKSFEVERRSSLMEAYTDAYLKWYKGEYGEAVKALSSFIAQYNDRYLSQQARLLLADSYWHLGKRSSACQVLESFVKKFKGSLFYCGAYYKARMIGCKIKFERECR